ncbi:MAG: hypothetical protein GY710_24810 [Desulfobacteraceae bacterium]|nr:hypothetical protein [Desulfobacteraceae bacterium]
MSVIIRSSKDWFRRCGVAHKKEPVTWPDEQFTNKELKRLKAEPKISVEIVQDTKGKTNKTKGKDQD